MSQNKKKPFGAFRKSFKRLVNAKDGTIVLSPSSLILTTYILLLFSKLIDLTLINRENEYFSVVILQMMIFLLPAAIWCRFSGEKYLGGLRLTMPHPTTLPLILSSAVLIASGGLLISLLLGGNNSISSNFSLYDTFVSKDTGTIPSKLYLILSYAALPAICEEFIFRGILCHEYEKGGVTRAIVLSTLFFTLLHFDIVNLPIYIFAGLILALTLYATRSLFAAMISHFLYNIFGLFGQPYLSRLYTITGSRSLFLIIVTLIFLSSSALFCGEAARLYKKYLYAGYSSKYREPIIEDPAKIKRSYIGALTTPSAILCFLIYIICAVISLF